MPHQSVVHAVPDAHDSYPTFFSLLPLLVTSSCNNPVNMDTQLQLKPKLPVNSVDICLSCNAFTPMLVEVFATNANGSSVKQDLCGTCLVGHDVPVFRAGMGWAFGEVMEYNRWQISPYRVSFPDGDESWVVIGRKPTDEYLSAQTSGKNDPLFSTTMMQMVTFTGTLDCPSFGSMQSPVFFDETSPASLANSHPNHTFPLMDENRLFFADLNNSFSTLDDDDIDCSAFLMPEDEYQEVEADSKKRKRKAPVKWSSLEDAKLLFVVREFKKKSADFIWDDVASLITGRTGKQCRERYLNYLADDVNSSKLYSPTEDALLFELFFRLGSQWSNISKMLRGRKELPIKNRFHSLRVKLSSDFTRKMKQYEMDSDEDEVVPTPQDYTSQILLKLNDDYLKILAAESLSSRCQAFHKGYKFGPFIAVTDSLKMCQRCSLFVPSSQTGSTVCSTTGWCDACTKLPPYLAQDTLRKCLFLRTSAEEQDSDWFGKEYCEME